MDSRTPLRTCASFDMPAGACDAHVHMIGDKQRFPISATRSYTPGEASLEQLNVLRNAFGLDRVVLVQPSFYGTDNACLLDALKRLGSCARGIVVIDEQVTDAELERMNESGIRGIRINPKGFPSDHARIADLAQRISIRVAPYGWHVQAFLPLSTVAVLHRTLAGLHAPIVLDHFAGASADGLDQPGLESLFKLLDSGNCYVKLSAPYHAARSAPYYPEMLSLAHALIARRSDRILWGSNWPHTNAKPVQGISALEVSPFRDVDNAALINLVSAWAPDAEIRTKILVDNPAALFAFPR